MKNSPQSRKAAKPQNELAASWTAAGREAPRRFRVASGLQKLIAAWLAQAVSPLRFATAVQNLCAFAPLRLGVKN
jgi:hypothetical protein